MDIAGGMVSSGGRKEGLIVTVKISCREQVPDGSQWWKYNP